MSAKLIVTLFCVQYIFLTNCQEVAKFFRKDYVYIDSTKSFYKIHTIHRAWEDAKEMCDFEGATLFYPYDEDEAKAVINYWNQTLPFPWIFIGVSTPNVREVFETVDGLSISQVYDNWGLGEPNNAGGTEGCVVLRKDGTLNDDKCAGKLPFICKKTLNTLEWNMLCDLPDMGYVYNELGRCYKFHLNPRSWYEAVKICDAEQSYLAIINSDAEADVLVNITKNAPKDDIEDTNYLNGAVHLGFKFNHIWKTIKHESLRRSGYSQWGVGQPDGKGKETCGSMFFNGKLNDISCDLRCFFICEHEPAILTTEYDFRFGRPN
ncbi:macrophage mannose receptor 1-like isoform X1 [Danaus plexippus]|uniref:macrophage mannose receptor 1-like isoform X1 n=1 Tax=Danaus plexippus TaxID=13037 RepID=UPI002AB01AD9|nr:macrophage mannose receptor 1-like isoform X1 [Danaus plexippus]